MKNFVIVTPVHPEVPPRNWAIHASKDMEKLTLLEKLHSSRMSEVLKMPKIFVHLKIAKNQSVILEIYVCSTKTFLIKFLV